MRLPRTSRPPAESLGELVLGMGDYVAGGSRSLPFLDLDGARRRRPLVLGEVTDDLDGYPALAAEMFSGRQRDPAEWSVMWKEIGADGVWIDLKGGDASLVEEIARRTRLPIAVTADDRVLRDLSGFGDSRLILFGREGRYTGPSGYHAVAVRGDNADSLAKECADTEASCQGGVVIDLGDFDVGDGLGRRISLAEDVRRRALAGERALRHPTVCSVTSCWRNGFSDARSASMWEAEAGLAAMLAGTDIIIARGPGAADMIRVYGEELADL